LKKIPIAAAGIAFFRSASAKMKVGDLPPSSRLTRLKLLLLASMIARPVTVEPVKATLSTSMWLASAAPAVRP
jgi:hypothetical protein